FVLEVVVPSGQRPQVVFVGFAAVFPGDDVVEFAAARLAGAVGEPAGGVGGGDVVDQRLRRLVGSSAVVEESPVVVGDQRPPLGGGVEREPGRGGRGDRPVAVEFGRVLVEAEQGGQRDGDLHAGPAALPGADLD